MEAHEVPVDCFSIRYAATGSAEELTSAWESYQEEYPTIQYGTRIEQLTENKIIIAKTGQQRFIGVRGDVNKTYQRIADLVQSILDKDNGYDANIFKDINSLYDDIFFGIDGNGVRTNQGLFKLYRFREKDKG